MTADDPPTESPSPPGRPPSITAPGPGSPVVPPPARGFAQRYWTRLSRVGLLLVPVVGILVWAGIALSYSDAEATHAGQVLTLSKKGWVCKTWEGELATATAPGVFAFSVRKDSLARALAHDMERGRVVLTYRVHRGVPTSCFGGTPYFVVSYRMVADADSSRLP